MKTKEELLKELEDFANEIVHLVIWESENFGTYKAFCIKKAYKNMIEKQVDYEYRGIKGFFKLLFEKEN